MGSIKQTLPTNHISSWCHLCMCFSEAAYDMRAIEQTNEWRHKQNIGDIKKNLSFYLSIYNIYLCLMHVSGKSVWNAPLGKTLWGRVMFFGVGGFFHKYKFISFTRNKRPGNGPMGVKKRKDLNDITMGPCAHIHTQKHCRACMCHRQTYPQSSCKYTLETDTETER